LVKGLAPSLAEHNNFNLLRLILACSVASGHTLGKSGSDNLLLHTIVGSVADVAVCGFFIISGFLIMRSFWSSNSIKDYFIKRGRRILPAYYLCIILSVLGFSLLSKLTKGEYFTSPILFKYIISNVFFVNFLQRALPGVLFSLSGASGVNDYLNSVNAALWTTKIEIAFYMAVPLLSHIIVKLQRRKKINVFLISLYIGWYLYRYLCKLLFDATDNEYIGFFAWQTSNIHYFFVGILCLVNYDFIRKHERRLIIPAVIVFIVERYISKSDYLLPISLGIIIMYIAFNFKTLNALAKNNDYSYGIYIYHYPIAQTLFILGYFTLNRGVTILVSLCVTFTLAYLSWNFLEKNMLKKKRQSGRPCK
jgi:peptidoglycan/LPS O-acetylase OafA/YrhL